MNAVERTAKPLARLEVISRELEALVIEGSFTGRITIHFQAGVPKLVDRFSCHGEPDGWAFAGSTTTRARAAQGE